MEDWLVGWLVGWLALMQRIPVLIRMVALVDRINHNNNNLQGAATATVAWIGKNPGGTLGTAQANPCCWLTPIGP